MKKLLLSMLLFTATSNAVQAQPYEPYIIERVTDICNGACDGDPINLYSANGKLYFTATDGVNGYQPWVSDGTNTGTFMLAKTWQHLHRTLYKCQR